MSNTYSHDHPFSPHYRGRIAEEMAKPRYPNRAHAPKEGTQVSLRGAVDLSKVVINMATKAKAKEK